MTTPLDPALQATAPTGRFDGRVAFQDWVRESLRAAASEGWREIILCDGDFRDWPLGEREVIDLLNQWASASRLAGRRKCIVLAATYEQLRFQHPRFVQWRGRWDHLLECRQLSLRSQTDAPSMLWSPHWALQRLDVERSRGVASADAQHCLAMREQLREWITARSRPGFPSTILGL